MKKEIFVFALLILTFFIAACDMLAPEPYEPALIAVKMAPSQRASKATGPVKKVWVMVIDYSPFVWDDENYDTHDYEDFVEPPDGELRQLFNRDYLTLNFTDSSGIFRNDLRLIDREHRVDRLADDPEHETDGTKMETRT